MKVADPLEKLRHNPTNLSNYWAGSLKPFKKVSFTGIFHNQDVFGAARIFGTAYSFNQKRLLIPKCLDDVLMIDLAQHPELILKVLRLLLA